MDFEVQRFTRRCAKTDRLLEPGETFCTVLVSEGADVVRYDFSEEAWDGPPEGTLGWWKSQVPTKDSKRVNLAPNEVMLELFDEWDGQPDKHDMRYVLTLLLIRRRVLRLEDSQRDEQGQERLVVYCPRREATYEVMTKAPSEARIQEIQDELSALLFANNA